MAFMGYDVERVVWLADAMRLAVDELTRIRNDDPAARSSLARLRTQEQLLSATWLPVLRQLLSCSAMTSPFEPVTLDGSDVRNAVLFVLQGYGWQVVTDPEGPGGDGTFAVTPSEARAIGAMLSRPDIANLLDTDTELVWLAGRLRLIAADPALAKDFALNLDDEWVLAVLADDRLAAATDGSGRTQLFDDVLASCVEAATAASASDAARGAWIDEMVERLDPYAAALVIRSLDLDGDALAGLCDRVLVRWRTPPDGLDGWPDSIGPEFTADLLFPLLVHDPAAATAFLTLAGAHPDVVFQSTNDGALVDDLLEQGTDPARVSVEEAGAILVPMLEWLAAALPWFHNDMIGGGFDARDLLGELIGPWLFWFGERASEWDWSFERADAVLQFVVEDGRALDDVVAAMAGWQDQLAQHPMIDADGRIDEWWVSNLATAFDQLQRALEQESVDDAAARRFWVDVTISLATTVATSIARATGVAGAAAVPPLVGVIQQHLTDSGWLPPDAELAGQIAHQERVERIVDNAVIAVVAAATQLIAIGDLPEDALDGLDLRDTGEGCDARTVRQRLRDFVEGLRERCSPAAYNAMVAVLATFLSASLVGEVC